MPHSLFLTYLMHMLRLSINNKKEQEAYFKRIELKNEKYLQNLILYVHLNPMKHFNIDFESYKYSSYPSILSDKPTTLKRNDVLQLFDGKENFKYVHQQKELEIEEKFKLE